ADAETTAFKTDMEAADEISRQLRLRDLGGVIICDFIDLRYERHRRDLERKLHDNLKKDRAKTKVLRMSQFGIIEMTRQRMRPSLKRSIYFDCPHCKGSGLVKTPESMSLDVMRKLAITLHDPRVARAELAVCPDVALYLLNKKRSQLAALETESKKKILIRHDSQLGLDEMKLELFDNREGPVYLESLGMHPQDQPAIGSRPDPRRGRRDDRRPRRPQNQEQTRRDTPADDRDEFEGVEDAVDQRERHYQDEAAAAVALPAPVLASAPSESSEKEDDDDSESNVIDIEEADEPMGEAPGAIDEPNQNGARHRRGGRGRGRGNPPPNNVRPVAAPPPKKILPPIAKEIPEPGNELTPPAEGDQPRRRRRRRGGRRHRRQRERANEAVKTNQPAENNSENGFVEEESEESRTSVPSRVPPPREPDPPVVRTGSTDKHLIHDEPILPDPPRRPRSYRDLDAIPDDQD
ncbi:MAG TPA: ribonuclease E/G, partial [Tepidisphaeraceae bacterium]|nr:ribonuclease E/G [Tepidisphaeraceae bacterium]